MFELGWIGELDGDAACAAVAANHQARLQEEATQLFLAAHWADLHNGDVVDSGGRVLPGTERAKQLGGPGTPRVAEFATAELGALQGIGYISTDNLERDALNLRHRHPLLWAAIGAGAARVWQAREVARLVHTSGLSLEEALWVDAQTTPRLGCLPWGRFLSVLEAKIIEADPDAAEARRVAAAMERFVRTGQCNEYGLKTIIAKATAGDAIHFLAILDRIAQILALGGDTDPVDVRRSKALGILANPARAYTLLQQHAQTTRDNPVGDPTSDRHGESGAADDGADGGVDLFGSGDPGEGERVGEGDVHPGHNDADDPAPHQYPCPACAGVGTVTGDPSMFVKPLRVDPAKLVPPATLYIHLWQGSFTRDTAGVARFEGVGPITTEQAREFLGHCQVSVKPVIDVAGQVPVDAYEVPETMREALHLRNPADVFPYGSNTSRRKDADHTIPYLSPDQGGPPGQSRLGNLGPLSRFPHRLKTHSRWRLRQPEPGVYLWRSPHGHYWLVDHTGTHPLAKAIGNLTWVGLNTGIDIVPSDQTLEYQSQHVA